MLDTHFDTFVESERTLPIPLASQLDALYVQFALSLKMLLRDLTHFDTFVESERTLPTPLA